MATTTSKYDTTATVSTVAVQPPANPLVAGKTQGDPLFNTPGTMDKVGQKFTNFFNSVSSTTAPNQNPMRSPNTAAALTASAPPGTTGKTTPTLDAFFSSPEFAQSTLNLMNILNPQSTTDAITKQMSKIQGEQTGLSKDQLQAMNLQTIMSGTTDDIRNEIIKGGGTATESQVQAMATARNGTLMEQASYLQNQMAYQQSLIQNDTSLMDFERSMASEQFSQKSAVIGMVQKNQTDMQNAAIDKYNNIIKNGGGYTTLANSLMAADPSGRQLQIASQLLGANLSDPAWLAQADQYNTARVQLEQAKATQAVYNYNLAGGAGGTTNTTNTTAGNYGTATSTVSQITGINPDTPLSQVDPTQLLPAILKNEGGSLPGVQNNPGNIKYVGLPGQIDSGVKASDGGTFANYATPQAGQQAVLENIQNADQNQTLGSFIDKYTNTAPKASLALGTTGYSTIDSTVPGYTTRAVIAGMTQSAIDQAAVQYATSGALPIGGRATTGVGLAISTAVKNRAGELDAKGNISTNKATLTALSSSLNTQTDYLTSTQRALKGADNSFNQLSKNFSGKINDQSMPIKNVLDNWVKYGLGGSQVPAYKASLAEIGNEYQQVFSRGGTVTDTVRKTSSDIIDGNISLADLQTVNTQLQAQGKIVVSAAQDQVDSITGKISNIVSGGKPNLTKGSMSNNDWVNTALTSQNISWTKATSMVPKGEIGVITNDGQFGSIPESDYDASLYTRI